MGLANADRTLDYIRILIQFISQPQYADVIPIFGVVNEALVGDQIPQAAMNAFYIQVHDMVRSITGTGPGKGPILSLHDGFTGPDNWAGRFPGSDRLAVDTHPYFAFAEQSVGDLQTQG
jgi:glucan 1,3-beta-glucosidase